MNSVCLWFIKLAARGPASITLPKKNNLHIPRQYMIGTHNVTDLVGRQLLIYVHVGTKSPPWAYPLTQFLLNLWVRYGVYGVCPLSYVLIPLFSTER